MTNKKKDGVPLISNLTDLKAHDDEVIRKYKASIKRNWSGTSSSEKEYDRARRIVLLYDITELLNQYNTESLDQFYRWFAENHAGDNLPWFENAEVV